MTAALPDPSPTADSNPRGLGCLIVGALVTVMVVGSVVATARYFEDRRLARIEHAEAKYGLTYVQAVRDGEGGSLWHTGDEAAVSCAISGPVTDPVLACGAAGAEPPQPSRRE